MSEDICINKSPWYRLIATLVNPLKIPSKMCTIEIVIEESKFKTILEKTENHLIHLRFFACDSSAVFNDCLPQKLEVEVNGQKVLLPHLKPSQDRDSDCVRLSRPLNITSSFKAAHSVKNTLKISWSDNNAGGYFIVVELVEKLTIEEHLRTLKTHKLKPVAVTHQMIKEKFKMDLEGGIYTVKHIVPLTCPLTKTRIETPCRSELCSHLQCFDARTFLKMNELRPTWKCPICNVPAHLEQLIIDEYFEDVLRSSQTQDVNEVNLQPDGSCVVIESVDSCIAID